MHLQVGHGQVDQGRGLPGGGHRVHTVGSGGVTENTVRSGGPQPGGSRERAVRWGSQSTQFSQLGHGQVDQGRGLTGGGHRVHS